MKQIFSQNKIEDNNYQFNNINNEDTDLELNDLTEQLTREPFFNEKSDVDVPLISPDNLYEYLEDNYEGDPEETLREDRIEEHINEDTVEEDPEDIPVDKDIKEFNNIDEAINWAQLNNKTMRINYITKKGNDLVRNIEPHGIFSAKTTGNRILVSYDQTVNEIRAFIIDNIINYLMLEDNFTPKFKIDNRREIKMTQNIFDNLKDIGDDLDKLHMTKNAETVTNVMNDLLTVKTAQYVGIQGYWIRNTRCFDNCYRQKRTKNKTSSAQDIWFECQKEYEESINNPDSNWKKYAGKDNMMFKTANNSHKNILNKEKEYFEKSIKKAMKEENLPFEVAAYNTLEKGPKRYEEMIIADATKLVKIASLLKKQGYNDLSKKVANTSLNVMKEAQFWSNVGDVARGVAKDIGQGVGKGIGKAKDWMGGKVQQYQQQGDVRRVNKTIENITNIIENATSKTRNTWGAEVAKINQLLPSLAQSQSPQAQQAYQVLKNWNGNFGKSNEVVQNLTSLSQPQATQPPEQQAPQSTQQQTPQAPQSQTPRQSPIIDPSTGQGFTT